ncbi:phytanoyl-CoA dioxygenase [Polychaeton citri CBS 116435]|uniref:Phytanoyl-CoA dioxygenase n=1 Tax=Polychaeton citri CBS 116435 TaxID=1314669 RepID=A0A9P4UPZ3_9PEZI|nr:phytanoyl-CoA dioxygenase [Polychaeton citri CBS 116435]
MPLGSRKPQRFIATTTTSSSSLPTIIRPNDNEVKSGKLDARNLEKAIRGIHEDGLIVISNVIPHDDLDRLNKKMTIDAKYLMSLGDKGPFNYNKGNLQQDPPPIRKHFSRSIFLNPIAIQVTSNVLGPKPLWTFCSGNTAIRGAEPQRQPVHSDADFSHPNHPFALVVNVPLITFTPENGSTEVWLGTHTPEFSGLHAQEGMHGDRASGRIREHLLEKRKQARPPSQPIIEKGSVVIRDLRLWHAGMPNHTDDIRVMLAMIHFAPWYRNRMRLELAQDIEPLLAQETNLGTMVDYISREDAMDRYLARAYGNAYDFNQVD